MKISVLGTGAVGQAMSQKLTRLGHQVFMGTRNVSESLSRTETDTWGTPGVGSWIKENSQVELVSFRESVKRGKDLIVFAMNGKAAMECLEGIGEELLGDRIMIDISNPLDFSKGFPPILSICNTESLGEKIQNSFPKLRVVKTLNTVSSAVMVNPDVIQGDHSLFICGNDEAAKAEVVQLLNSIGWGNRNIIDLGDITSARGTEMMMPLFIRLIGKFQSPLFNININTKTAVPAQ